MNANGLVLNMNGCAAIMLTSALLVTYIHHCMSSNSAATLHRTMTVVSGLVVLACGALCSEGFVLKQRREAASANQGKFLLEFLLPATLLASSYIAIIYKYVISYACNRVS